MTITIIIIVITCITSLLSFQNNDLKHKMLFTPYLIAERKQWYRFLTYGFIHADIPHLAFNMITLYFFGQLVEDYYAFYFAEKGILFYLLLYIGGCIMSSYYSYEKNKTNPYYSALGASGAVAAILFAGIVMEPKTGIYIMFIPFPIPGYLFGILYLIYSWYMAKKERDNVGHDAHFWGAVFGILFTIILKPSAATEFIYKITGN